jgi:hypothetical protein
MFLVMWVVGCCNACVCVCGNYIGKAEQHIYSPQQLVHLMMANYIKTCTALQEREEQ